MQILSYQMFQTFEIAGPFAGTTVLAAGDLNGQAVGDCLWDSFQAGSIGFPSTPIICGYNTGQHSKKSLLIYNKTKHYMCAFLQYTLMSMNVLSIH